MSGNTIKQKYCSFKKINLHEKNYFTARNFFLLIIILVHSNAASKKQMD